jgi:integrase
MGKRANGEGSITKYKDGRWCGRYTIHTPNGPKRKAVYGKTKAEVRIKLTKAMAEADEGLTFDTQNLTVEEYLSRWLTISVSGSVRENTYERYEQLVRNHITPSLGSMKLRSLTPMHLQGLYRKKLDSGLAPRTVQYIHATLHKALKQALRWGHVARNVAEAVDRPKLTKKEIQPLDREQAQAFLEAARVDRLEALYVLAVSAGLRQGELLGLKWDDIDFGRGTLQVRRSLSRTKDGTKFVPPKSAKSRRSITLTASAVEALKRHRAVQDEEKLGTAWEEEGLVFPNDSGRPMRPWILAKGSFKKILARAGLPEKTRFHDLRHTCATLLLSKGVHPKIVQELLGHSTISITLDTYSHVLPNMQGEAVTAMEDLLD